MNFQQLDFYGMSGAYQKRWDRVTEVRTDLQAELIEAEVLWGKALNVLCDSIFKLERELFLALRNYITIINPATEPETKKAYIEIKRMKRDILYEISEGEPDEYAQDLTSAITAIENYLKPHLRR